MFIIRNGFLFEVSQVFPSSFEFEKSPKVFFLCSYFSPCCIVKFVNFSNEKEVYYDFFYEDFYQVLRKLSDFSFPVTFYDLDNFLCYMSDLFYVNFC